MGSESAGTAASRYLIRGQSGTVQAALAGQLTGHHHHSTTGPCIIFERGGHLLTTTENRKVVRLGQASLML